MNKAFQKIIFLFVIFLAGCASSNANDKAVIAVEALQSIVEDKETLKIQRIEWLIDEESLSFGREGKGFYLFLIYYDIPDEFGDYTGDKLAYVSVFDDGRTYLVLESHEAFLIYEARFERAQGDKSIKNGSISEGKIGEINSNITS